MKRLVAAALVVGVATAAGPAGASILCKTKQGGLVVRDACKKKESPVDPAQLGLQGPRGAQGLQGPQGPPGSAGLVGPGGSGLRAVDSTGQEVGLVTAVGFPGQYGGTEEETTNVEVIRQVPAGTGEFFLFRVTPGGIHVPTPEYGAQAFLDDLFVYASANCTGTRYLGQGPYGATAPFMEFAHNLIIDPSDGHTGYYFEGSELQNRPPYFALTQVPGANPTAATQGCTQPRPTGAGGQVIGTVTLCPSDSGQPPGSSCAQCCVTVIPQQETSVAPTHTLDMSTLGVTPPFRVQR